MSNTYDHLLKRSNLTQNQLQIYLGQKIHPDLPIYNNAALVTLRGEIDLSLFRKSFQLLINSSDALRTVFRETDGIPRQEFIDFTDELVKFLDWSDEKNAEEKLAEWANKQGRKIFNFEERLFESVLIKLSSQKFIWFINFHAIICDGWSVALLIARMAEAYDQLKTGNLNYQPEIPQFREFIKLEREYLQSPRYTDDKQFWNEKLSAETGSVSFYGKTPQKQSARVERVYASLGKERTARLREIAQTEGILQGSIDVTLFNIFLSILATFIYHVGGNRRFYVGCPFHNRRTKTLKETIGSFLQVIPFGVTVEEEDTFLSLMEKIGLDAMSSLRHRQYAIRNPGNRQVYDIWLNYHNIFSVKFNGYPMETQVIHTGYGYESFGLRIHDFDMKGNFVLDFDLHLDVFPPELHPVVVNHFLKTVDTFIDNPERPVREVDLSSPEEKHRVLVEFNQTRASYPETATVHQLFEEQAARTPNATAVSFEDMEWSYRELNHRANHIARYLLEKGLEAGQIVGILAERSPEALAAMFGVLKAGGTYLPLDPTYPPERLNFILEDAGIKFLLTTSGLPDNLRQKGLKIFDLKSDDDIKSGQDDENPAIRVDPDSPAYVIYTSGSTGTPKGIEIPHQALVNFALAAKEEFRLTPTDSVLQFAPLSFDTSAEEIYPALFTGARLVIRTDEMLRSVSHFLHRCREWKVTVMDLPTVFWHEMVNAISEENLPFPPEVRLVIIGGDKADATQVKLWQERVGKQVRLLNTYGPTETTVAVTMGDLTEYNVSGGIVPIGRPIKNCRIYLLDENLRPVPLGVAGEICVSGIPLARGYLNRPELTQEKFIPDPFAETPGERLYRTGDLGRFLPDGTIEFLGRIDFQIKIRGYRVEPGEVEAAITRHPDVKEALVLPRTDESNQQRLVAYVVTKSGDGSDAFARKLRHFLEQKLPDYMIPNFFVFLKSFPLTPNGKIDRKALPEPQTQPSRQDHEYTAPQNEVEKRMAEIWSEALRVDTIGIHDNFFELGGDSIIGIQIISKMNRVGLYVTPKQLFQYPTIAQLSQAVKATAAVKPEQGIVTGEIPLTPYQHWFFEQDFANPHHWNMAALLEVWGVDNPSAIKKAIPELLRHHDALRIRFRQTETGWKQVNAAPDDAIPFEFIDISHRSREDQGSAIRDEATRIQESLNLTTGPVIQFAYFDTGQQPHRLLIVAHHMVIDGISWRILLEDLNSLVQKQQRGEAMQLPPKTTSYKQWAEKLGEYAQSEQIKQELPFWSALAEASVSVLPRDFPRGENRESSADTVQVFLTPEETARLLTDVHSAYNTQINDLLLAALAMSLQKQTGNSGVFFDLEAHGREEIIPQADISRTVGCFTALFPVRLNINSLSDPGEIIKSVKEQLRRIPRQGVGFGILRYLCRDEQIAARLKQIPRAEISFNYLGQIDSPLSDSARLRITMEPCGPVRSPEGKRSHIIEILGAVHQNKLQFQWIFSKNLHRKETVEALAREHLESLRALIRHCTSEHAGGYTPSDFPYADLTQQKLDSILNKIENEWEE